MNDFNDKANDQNSSDNNNLNDIAEQQNNSNHLVADDFNYVIGDNGFDINSLEESNSDAPIFKASREAKKKQKKKRTVAKIRSAIWIIVIFAVSVILAASIMLFAVEYLGITFGNTAQCVVEIEKGMGTSQIAKELESSGAINSSFMFRVYSRLSGKDGSYQYGVYTFSNELGYSDIARKLQEEGATAKSVTVTIPEMSRMDQIMDILEKNGVCTKADFRNAVLNGTYEFDFVKDIPEEEVYYKFEGYLFPDTYDFYCYDSAECAELAILKMLENTNSKLTPEVRQKIEKSGYTIHEVLSMASIVELEASAYPEEMANVAAVFYNRLSWDEPKFLGSSPTAEYPFGNGRYNTNSPDGTEGFPPGPMCAPSLNAILAAVNPTENFSATYFVTDSDMKFYYNTSYSAHIKTINNLKAQGKWLG